MPAISFLPSTCHRVLSKASLVRHAAEKDINIATLPPQPAAPTILPKGVTGTPKASSVARAQSHKGEELPTHTILEDEA